MAFFDEGIIAVCLVAGWGGLRGAALTISILDKKTPHKQRSRGPAGQLHTVLSLHTDWCTKGPRGGKLKDGTLAHSADFPSVASLSAFQGLKKDVSNGSGSAPKKGRAT